LGRSQAQLRGTEEYKSGAPITDFATINRRTNLASLNLNWTEHDLPERVRTKHVHRLHPYLGKYIPQMVEIFLRKFAPKRVFDPFVGSGTTLVEANVLGIESFGTDVSAFNCLLSRVKTARYDLPKLGSEVLRALQQLEFEYAPSLFTKDEPVSTESVYLRTWYHPDALRALLLFRSAIEQYEYQDVLKVILSRAARSARLTAHFDLDFPRKPQSEPYYCHKHDRICPPTTDAVGFLRRYALDTLKRITEFAALRSAADAHVIYGDAQTVKLPPIDMLITSPPYVGLIDYHEQHRYAYELLGLPWKADAEIGAAQKGKSRAAHEDYMRGIGAVFENARKFLRKNGVMVIVVGDRENLYQGLAKELGFKQKQRLRRHVNRRTGRRSTDFFEDVLIWSVR